MIKKIKLKNDQDQQVEENVANANVGTPSKHYTIKIHTVPFFIFNL